jgi:type IV pilus assembly protein PilA
MVKRTREIFKSQKGFTLVELLAVIVILGIIAAIAVPSIGGIIDNTKKDAYIANAQQMVSGARMALAGGENQDTNIINNKSGYRLKTLIDKGYIEPFTDPDTKGTYDATELAASYVLIEDHPDGTNNKIYRVYLDGKKRVLKGSDGYPVNIKDVDRDNVFD